MEALRLRRATNDKEQAAIPKPKSKCSRSMNTNFTIPRFEGVLERNYKLQRIEKLFEGKIVGPDSVVQDTDGGFYSGLADGRIVKLYPNGNVEEIARTGKLMDNCGTYDTEETCGRPLGLRFDKTRENLIICDAYYGLLSLNLKNRSISTLITHEEGVDGIPFRFMNDVTIGEGNMIYFTDSSWKWKRIDSRYAVLEATGRGRVVSFNTETRQRITLLAGLLIPNGLEISKDFSFLLVAETTSSRITKYYLKGPKKGKHEVFAENLPGYPANIRASPTGGYWLGLIAVRKWPFSFLDIAGPYPFLRRLLAKAMSQDTMTMLIPRYGMIIKLDDNGSIIDSLQDPSGAVMDEVTDVFQDPTENAIYLGSYKHKFLGKLKLS
eukprot:gene3079-1365_t